MQAVMKMTAAPGLTVRDVDVPVPQADEVLIQVKAAALCGTDIHIADWSMWAQHANLKLPLVVGHECAGVVTACGQNVTELKVGDHVAVETHIPCGKCLQCLSGESHICHHLKIFGVHTDGCFAPYAVVPALCAHKIDAAIPFATAAVLEPLGTAVRAVSEARVGGRQVVIIGCGPVGLFAVGAARFMGAAKIIAIDVSPFRLQSAQQMGATDLLNPSVDDVAGTIMNRTSGFGADCIIEASGNAGAIRQAFDFLRKGGTMALIGLPGKPVELELGSQVVFKEAHVFGIHGRRMFDTWYQVEQMLLSNRFDVTPVLTRQMPLHDIDCAIDMAKRGEANKIILLPQD